jgi:hypothetical protein
MWSAAYTTFQHSHLRQFILGQFQYPGSRTTLCHGLAIIWLYLATFWLCLALFGFIWLCLAKIWLYLAKIWLYLAFVWLRSG